MAFATQVRENNTTSVTWNHVREEPQEYSKSEPATPHTKHDLLFKQLISNFFAEFLEAFFPQVYLHVDLKAIKPVSEEVYTDLIDGKTRRLDIVMETKLKGEDTVLIIHVEPQSYIESNFHERMYHYFSLLYNKLRKPILPIAVFSYDQNRNELDEFIIEFPFFHVLKFKYMMLELKKENWRNYIRSDNPVAAALLSKMGYSEEERIEVKMEFLKMLVRMELNPAESRFINAFFESYLVLTNEEEEKFMEGIRQMDNADEILNLPNSWEERGIRKGREQGIEKGIEKGKWEEKRNNALKMLKKGLSMELISEVTGLTKEEIEKLRMDL